MYLNVHSCNAETSYRFSPPVFELDPPPPPPTDDVLAAQMQLNNLMYDGYRTLRTMYVLQVTGVVWRLFLLKP